MAASLVLGLLCLFCSVSTSAALSFDPRCEPSSCPCRHDLRDHLAPAPRERYDLAIAVVAADDSLAGKPSSHVQSAHRAARNAIRHGWKALATAAAVPVFFFRSSGCLAPEDRKEEARRHDTVVLQDPDGEACGLPGLSVKTLMLMRFMARQCATVKYLLKCTDDTFVHVPRLLAFIQQAPPSQAIGGYVKMNISAGLPGIRSTPGFHRETGLPKYPRHMHRGAYLLSGDVAVTLGTISYHVPLRLWRAREEVALATWLLGWNLTVYDFRRPKMYLRFSHNMQYRSKGHQLCEPHWMFAHQVDFGAFEAAYQHACGGHGDPLTGDLNAFHTYIARNKKLMLWRTP
eukprot:GGOE01025583.1.p1 GENE.GGOE01025583.1~~GGOE01025583.1.p1  ORF type:complete len:358 (+),score=82.89 GGOE01025583.1:42-1076(+)